MSLFKRPYTLGVSSEWKIEKNNNNNGLAENISAARAIARVLGITITMAVTMGASAAHAQQSNNFEPYAIGDVIAYTHTATNDGDVDVTNIAVNNTYNDSGPAPVSGGETLLTDTAPTGVSTDAVTGTYTVTKNDAETL